MTPTLRTVNPLVEKILALKCYVSATQLDSDIESYLLENAKIKYEGKKYLDEGIIVKIESIIKRSDIETSNEDTTGDCEASITVKCLICLISSGTKIVCKISTLSNSYFYANALNNKILITVMFNESRLNMKSKISKDTLVVVGIHAFQLYTSSLFAISYFEDFANETEIAQYHNNEHKVVD